MRILAVTSWGGACGIANYAEQMIAATQAADPSLEFEPHAEALDPLWGVTNAGLYDCLWLNYHRGLHSRWDGETVHRIRQQGHRMVITFHDTYGERPPDALTQALHDLADAFVVHEPCEGLPKQILIRQGVPAPGYPMQYDWSAEGWCGGVRPILGTAGFNFPWKLYDEIAQTTAAAGWAFLLCANNATDADEARWKTLNPRTCVLRGFQPTAMIVKHLAGCDATAVMYRCANSGTSGAIRLCLAAQKPLFVAPCRQWNDLKSAEAEWGVRVLREVADCAALRTALTLCPIQRVDPAVVFAADQDSWVRQGAKYAEIFRSL